MENSEFNALRVELRALAIQGAKYALLISLLDDVRGKIVGKMSEVSASIETFPHGTGSDDIEKLCDELCVIWADFIAKATPFLPSEARLAELNGIFHAVAIELAEKIKNL